MEEMIDVLNAQTGEKTGEIISKKEAHIKGVWHGSIHVIIVNQDKTKTLLQKRAAEKDLYPNMWDIAVGGHISAGEDDLTSATRELKEELSIDADKIKIERMGRIIENFTNNGVISNEYVSVFIAYTNLDLDKLKLQKEEVSEIKWCTKEELNNLITNEAILPHHQEFAMLNEILEGQR